MHDPQLERQLRTALRTEGDRLTFTITAAELDRRLALRRRARPNWLASLGLAAAVTVGLLGLVGVAGGWFDRSTTPPAVPSGSTAPEQTAAPTPPPSVTPAALPALWQLIDAGDATAVVIAQSHGPELGQGPLPSSMEIHPPSVDLGPLDGPADYAITVGCISGGFYGYGLVPPDQRGGGPVPSIPCRGDLSTGTIHVERPVRLSLVTSANASWRVVVRRVGGTGPVASGEPEVPVPAPGEQVLLGVGDARNRSDEPAPSFDGLGVPQLVGGIPGREAYTVR
ncbi:MAG: hypothetical protein ABJC39_09630, partial [Chloroflexota bacterium]